MAINNNNSKLKKSKNNFQKKKVKKAKDVMSRFDVRLGENVTVKGRLAEFEKIE